jgi:hypothetical protein
LKVLNVDHGPSCEGAVSIRYRASLVEFVHVSQPSDSNVVMASSACTKVTSREAKIEDSRGFMVGSSANDPPTAAGIACWQ